MREENKNTILYIAVVTIRKILFWFGLIHNQMILHDLDTLCIDIFLYKKPDIHTL